MTHRKNGFWNFWCSLVPGCGQMYQGFLKRGVSIMSIFFGIIFLTYFFRMDAIALALPVVWAFAFFDSMHCNSLTLEERMLKKDDFFAIGDYKVSWSFFRKYRTRFAYGMIAIAGYALIVNFVDVLEQIGFFHFRWGGTYYVRYYVPRFAISALVIAWGISIILGKKKMLDESTETLDEE